MKQKLRKTLSLTLLILSLTSCQTYVVHTQETPNSQTTIVETQEVEQESKTQKSESREVLKKNIKKTTSATTEKIKEIKQTTKVSETTVKETSNEVKETTGKETQTQVKQKSIEEVAKDVLNGKYGNGEQRKANLEKEGYNYNEVQTAVEKLIPTPTQSKQTQAQQSSTTEQSQTQYNYAPLSLVINGEYFTMNTPYGPGEEPQTPVLQAILDRYNKEWVVENAINYKTHGDGQMPYLSMHNYPWGHYIRYVNQILFTDSNGVTKTYVKAQTHGPIDFATGASNPERSALRNGGYGDGLVFQTCVDNYYNFVLVRFVLAE